MYKIIYVTGNQLKVRLATEVCKPYGFSFEQSLLDIPEIQAENGETIARTKANEAFTRTQKPIVLSDDSWIIPGLKGFPGPYMKYMNEWLASDDWVRLTTPLDDRRIILRQCVVYQDATVQQTFYTDVEGTLLPQAKGSSPFPHMTITSFDGGKTSVAEAASNGQSAIFQADRRTSWHDFAEWYTKTHAK
jgi:inosine/xanthosine triphosphate pyrophosphatase family protein